MDYDGGSGNSMASKGRVQALCKPGKLWCAATFPLVLLVSCIAVILLAPSGSGSDSSSIVQCIFSSENLRAFLDF